MTESKKWTLEQTWEQMCARSFEPRDWFSFEEEDSYTTYEVKIMWVYRWNKTCYEVGYWTPDKEWVKDTECTTQDEAAQRVHYLNGGC